MNILILTPKGNSFNSIRPEAEIYVSLEKEGHNVTVMTNKGSKYIERYLAHNVEVIETAHKKKILISFLQQVQELFQMLRLPALAQKQN